MHDFSQCPYFFRFCDRKTIFGRFLIKLALPFERESVINCFTINLKKVLSREINSIFTYT